MAIDIDTTWRGVDDATGMEWVSDDGQGVMRGRLDPSRSVEAQMEEWRRELEGQGVKGGTISLCMARASD